MTRLESHDVGVLPLILAICATPLLVEALVDELDGFAEVRAFPAAHGDVSGLVRFVTPDAIVVERACDAAELEVIALELDVPLIHVVLRTQQLRAFSDDGWREVHEEESTPQLIRNLLLGELFQRTRRSVAAHGRPRGEREKESEWKRT